MRALPDLACGVRSVWRTWRSHTDYGHVATVEMPARILGRAQQTLPDTTRHKLIEARFRDRRLPGIDDRYLFIADVDSDDFAALLGEASGQRHSDVTKSEHCNFHPNSPHFRPVTITLGRADQVRAKRFLFGLSGYPIVGSPGSN